MHHRHRCPAGVAFQALHWDTPEISMSQNVGPSSIAIKMPGMSVDEPAKPRIAVARPSAAGGARDVHRFR